MADFSGEEFGTTDVKRQKRDPKPLSAPDTQLSGLSQQEPPGSLARIGTGSTLGRSARNMRRGSSRPSLVLPDF